MRHIEMVEKLKKLLKVTDDAVDCWFPNGKNSVRVRMANGVELVYTYIAERNWRLETVHSWMEGKR